MPNQSPQTTSFIRATIINLLGAMQKRLAGPDFDDRKLKINGDSDKWPAGTLFDISADAIIVLDHRQIITRFNRGAEHVFGYTEAEAIGLPIDILLPLAFIDSHREDMKAFAAGDAASRLMGTRREIFGRRKNGEEFPAEASISKVTEKGSVTFHAILRDISERKLAEEALHNSEDRFRRIFEYSNDAIFVVDPIRGDIVDVNPTTCRMFGFSQEELMLMKIADIHPKDSTKFREFALSVVDQGQGWTDELVCLTKSGDMLPSEISASLIDVGERRLMIALFRDITERKEVERMKDDFISNVSHELRTPITSMKLYSHLMALKPEKQEDYMKRLIREIERQEYIIEDLLRLSCLDKGKTALTLIPTNLNSLAAEFITDRTPIAQTRRLTLAFEGQPELPLVLTDEGLLGQVLSILLTNAFNYTPPGKSVTVSTLSEESAWAGLRVSDTGPGIPAEDHAHLFERFYRGKVGRESREPGTGLGLAIAQEIVERHHGRIEVGCTGSAGEGAVFTIWLPTTDTG